ncbi:unnamed protein product, partial [Iphiclides podalirius]
MLSPSTKRAAVHGSQSIGLGRAAVECALGPSQTAASHRVAPHSSPPIAPLHLGGRCLFHCAPRRYIGCFATLACSDHARKGNGDAAVFVTEQTEREPRARPRGPHRETTLVAEIAARGVRASGRVTCPADAPTPSTTMPYRRSHTRTIICVPCDLNCTRIAGDGRTNRE